MQSNSPMTAKPGLAGAFSQNGQAISGRCHGAIPNSAVPELYLSSHVTHVGPSYQSLNMLGDSSDVPSRKDGGQLDSVTFTSGHLYFGSPTQRVTYTLGTCILIPTLWVNYTTSSIRPGSLKVHQVESSSANPPSP